MYTHCMFCHGALGANDEIEHFPVGRVLAYDEERGRLWAVCPRCRRWNLTPMAERWEALEECEKAFRGAALGASSENVSVARTRGGLDLVRIGDPLRREMAFWRWADRFRNRRRKALVWGTALGVGLTVGAVGNVVAGGGVFLALVNGVNVVQLMAAAGHRVRVEDDQGKTINLRAAPLRETRFGEPDGSGVPSLVVRQVLGIEHTLTGERALRAAALILPRINRGGAKDDEVHDAVEAIEEAGGAEGFVASTWGDPGPDTIFRPLGAAGKPGVLARLPAPTRAGLEMALHEEEERRALAGELAGLEAMWRRAEELASIADNLLLPSGWDAFRRLHAPDEEAP